MRDMRRGPSSGCLHVCLYVRRVCVCVCLRRCMRDRKVRREESGGVREESVKERRASSVLQALPSTSRPFISCMCVCV